LFDDIVGDTRLRSRGPAPLLSDVELLTAEIFAEFQGFDEDKHIWRYIRDHWKGWFPMIGSYKNFTKHSANLMIIKNRLVERLCEPACEDTYFAVDGVPIRVCRFARAKSCKLFPQEAAFGYCAAQKENYYGFRGVFVASDTGKICAANLVPANCDERQALLDMPLKMQGHMLGDKGFIGKEFQKTLDEQYHIKMHTPLRSNMEDTRPKALVKLIMNKRRYIETIIGKLVEQFSIAVVKARDIWHLSSRFYRKIIAYNLAVDYFGGTQFKIKT